MLRDLIKTHCIPAAMSRMYLNTSADEESTTPSGNSASLIQAIDKYVQGQRKTSDRQHSLIQQVIILWKRRVE